MAKFKPYDQAQYFFQTIDPRIFKANNPLLRVINEFVDEHLEVERFAAKVLNDEAGAAAHDPRLVVKVLLYSMATGVRSYRAIEERLGWDPAFLILSGQKVFDHSTLCRFIWRHKEALVEFFTLTVYVLIDQGYMSQDFIGTDGTKIKAWAGKDFTGTLEDFRRRSKKLEERINEILTKMGKDPNPDPQPSEKLRNLQRKKEKIDRFLEQVKKESGKIGANEKVNLTDLDARSMKDKDRTYAGYNLQLSVDGNHFIAAFGIYTCTADQPHLQPMVSKLQQQYGDRLSKSILAFDAGYYSGENLLFLERENLNAYIPEGQAEDGRKVIRRKPVIGSKDCTLIDCSENPLLVCPANQVMRGIPCDRSKGIFYRFKAEKEKCGQCNLLKECYGKRKTKYFEMTKMGIVSYQARMRMREKVRSEEGRARRNQRFSTGEHVNAEIKDQMRVRQFHHCGKERVHTISALIATAYNLRRLAAVS